MPGEASTVGANNALDGMLGRVTQTARTVYIALLTAAPTDATTLATMAELSATGYARQAYGPTAPTGDPSSTKNTAVLTFGPFTTDPANATHCACVSAVSGTVGDFIFWWALDVAKDAAVGESIQFAANALVANAD